MFLAKKDALFGSPHNKSPTILGSTLGPLFLLTHMLTEVGASLIGLGICIYIYMYICAYTYISMYVCLYVYTYVYTYIYIPTQLFVYLFVLFSVYVFTGLFVYAFAYETLDCCNVSIQSPQTPTTCAL